MEGIKDETPEECARRLYIALYPNWYDNGQFMKNVVTKDMCRIVAGMIIKETLDEYTNDENHVRVEFWKKVMIEIESF